MSAPEQRMCVVCGKEFDAELFKRGDAPCGAEDEFAPCTLDMTHSEAWLHWRQLAHDRYARIAQLEAERDERHALHVEQVRITNEWIARADRAEARLRKAVEAGNRLSFAAQTTGGTAGRDEGLVAAIDAWAATLARLQGESDE